MIGDRHREYIPLKYNDRDICDVNGHIQVRQNVIHVTKIACRFFFSRNLSVHNSCVWYFLIFFLFDFSTNIFMCYDLSIFSVLCTLYAAFVRSAFFQRFPSKFSVIFNASWQVLSIKYFLYINCNEILWFISFLYTKCSYHFLHCHSIVDFTLLNVKHFWMKAFDSM